MKRMAVQVQDLSVSFGSHLVLDRVTVDFPASGISVLVGRSGSGKTTLLRAINRLNEEFPDCATKGQVSIDFGQGPAPVYPDPRQPEKHPLPLTELRRRAGMLFQTPNLFPVSVRRNLSLPLRLVAGCPDNNLDEQIQKALLAVGLWNELKDRLAMPAEQLSGGQQQRLCLARTLCLSPSLLLLDEPTASLDVHAAQEIESLLLDLATRYPVIMVSHSPAQARRLGSRIIICEHGRITASLAPSELLSEDTLARLL